MAQCCESHIFSENSLASHRDTNIPTRDISRHPTKTKRTQNRFNISLQKKREDKHDIVGTVALCFSVVHKHECKCGACRALLRAFGETEKVQGNMPSRGDSSHQISLPFPLIPNAPKYIPIHFTTIRRTSDNTCGGVRHLVTKTRSTHIFDDTREDLSTDTRVIGTHTYRTSDRVSRAGIQKAFDPPVFPAPTKNDNMFTNGLRTWVRHRSRRRTARSSAVARPTLLLKTCRVLDSCDVPKRRAGIQRCLTDEFFSNADESQQQQELNSTQQSSTQQQLVSVETIAQLKVK